VSAFGYGSADKANGRNQADQPIELHNLISSKN